MATIFLFDTKQCAVKWFYPLIRNMHIVNKNNWLHRKTTQSSDYVLLGGILLFCLLYRLFYFGFLHQNMILYNSDSVSNFATVDIFRGVVDLYRTPLYPYVIEFFEHISKDNLVQNLILFQQIISFLSLMPFYFVSKSIIKNKYLIIITTVFYGCWHPIIIRNVYINPECLCFAGSTLMMFIFVKYLKKPKKSDAIFIGIFPLILTMLKPTYLILIGVVTVFLIFRFIFLREERKILYWGFIGLFITVAGVLGYCEMNERHNGQFVLSNVFLNDLLAHIDDSGAYRQGGDEELIAIIDAVKNENYYAAPFIINGYADNYLNCYKRFPKYLPPTDDMLFCLSLPHSVHYSPNRVKQFMKKSHRTMIYWEYMIDRMIDVVLAYGNLFILFVLQAVIIMGAFVKRKKIAWAQSFCLLFVLGQFFTIIIGGMDDLDRLLIPSYPFITQIAASFLAILISSLNKEKIVELIS